MVSLLYEFSDDRALDAAQAETFKKTYGVTWPVVPIPGSIDDFAEILPRGLADINPAGFPSRCSSLPTARWSRSMSGSLPPTPSPSSAVSPPSSAPTSRPCWRIDIHDEALITLVAGRVHFAIPRNHGRLLRCDIHLHDNGSPSRGWHFQGSCP
jgi:hypothetical protein